MSFASSQLNAFYPVYLVSYTNRLRCASNEHANERIRMSVCKRERERDASGKYSNGFQLFNRKFEINQPQKTIWTFCKTQLVIHSLFLSFTVPARLLYRPTSSKREISEVLALIFNVHIHIHIRTQHTNTYVSISFGRYVQNIGLHLRSFTKKNLFHIPQKVDSNYKAIE